MLVAAFGIAVILLSVGGSAPALAQTCQQKCEARFPNDSDNYQRQQKVRCINACVHGKK